MTEESRLDRVSRFAKIWWKSRADSGKSQNFMAMSLGVSKKTVQNWEKGTSSPDLFQGSEWFRVLAINPLPYYLAFLYPDLFDEIAPAADDQKIEDALISLIKQSTMTEKRQLLYLMAGEHGGSWYSLLQMFTAHCHTTMQSRVSAARIILDNYEIEAEKGTLVCPDNILPNLEILALATERIKQAAQREESGYTTAT